MKLKRINSYKLAYIGVLSALSIVLALIIHFPIFPSVPFLEYDPADIPIIIATFLYGPVTGLVMTLIVSVIQGITVSAESGIIGIAMHFFATSSFVITAGIIYRIYHTKKGAFFSLLSAIVVWCLIMIPLNLIFTPMYGVPIDTVKDLLLPAIIPFNLIKATINSIVTFMLYKHLHTLFDLIENTIKKRNK